LSHRSSNYFTRRSEEDLCALGFGDEEIISKNRETISNPAMEAPMIICFYPY